jgi:CheY-like chemotaxis protein
MALTNEGYAVQCAADGAAALAQIEHCSPDLILLDMKMPVMDGWEFAREYRRKSIPRAPIVVITAATDASRRAVEIGADGYLSKPCDLEELFRTVQRFAGRPSPLAGAPPGPPLTIDGAPRQ